MRGFRDQAVICQRLLTPLGLSERSFRVGDTLFPPDLQSTRYSKMDLVLAIQSLKLIWDWLEEWTSWTNNGPEPNQAEPTIKHQECASSLKYEADPVMKCENIEQGRFDATRSYGHRSEEAQVKADSTKNSYGDAQVTGPHTNVVDD